MLPLQDTPWTGAAHSFILFKMVDYESNKAQPDDVEKLNSFEIAKSALEVVEVSMDTLGALQLDPTGSQLLATIFCLCWAFLNPSFEEVADGEFDDPEEERRVEEEFLSTETGEESVVLEEVTSTHYDIERSRVSFLNCLQKLRRSSSPVSFQRLDTECRGRIREILIEVVRNALVLEESPDTVSTSTLCAKWVREIVEYFCVGEYEIQDSISCALAPSLSWPTWVADTQYTEDSFPTVKFPQKLILAKVRPKLVLIFLSFQ